MPLQALSAPRLLNNLRNVASPAAPRSFHGLTATHPTKPAEHQSRVFKEPVLKEGVLDLSQKRQCERQSISEFFLLALESGPQRFASWGCQRPRGVRGENQASPAGSRPSKQPARAPSATRPGRCAGGLGTKHHRVLYVYIYICIYVYMWLLCWESELHGFELILDV